MAIRLDRPRFRSIFARMEIEQAPADEFVDAVEDAVNEGRDELVKKDDLLSLEARLKQDAAEREARLKQDAAEREARILQNQLVIVGVILGAMAIATGIIIAVVTLST